MLIFMSCLLKIYWNFMTILTYINFKKMRVCRFRNKKRKRFKMFANIWKWCPAVSAVCAWVKLAKSKTSFCQLHFNYFFWVCLQKNRRTTNTINKQSQRIDRIVHVVVVSGLSSKKIVTIMPNRTDVWKSKNLTWIWPPLAPSQPDAELSNLSKRETKATRTKLINNAADYPK